MPVNAKEELILRTSIRDILASFSHAVEERTGRPMIDFKWPNKLIYFHLINQRANLMYEVRKQNKLENHFEDYTEVIPCVSMHEVDMANDDCPCAPASGCTFMKSVHPLPAMVGNKPESVANLTGFTRYDFVPWEHFKHRVSHRFSAMSEGPFYTLKTIENKRWLYTYITDDTKARKVSVSGLFVDPMEVFFFEGGCQPPREICDVLDLEFIIEKRLINLLFSATFQKLVQINSATRLGDTKADDRNAETSFDPRY